MKLCICVCYDKITGHYKDICKCTHRSHNGYCLSKYFLQNRKINYNMHKPNKLKLSICYMCL